MYYYYWNEREQSYAVEPDVTGGRYASVQLFATEQEAIDMVHYLNGGSNDASIIHILGLIVDKLSNINASIGYLSLKIKD